MWKNWTYGIQSNRNILRKNSLSVLIYVITFLIIEIIFQPVQFLHKLKILQLIAQIFYNWHHHGTKELAHLEMVGTIVHQLTDGASPEEMKQAGLGAYYTDHGVGLEYIQIRI